MRKSLRVLAFILALSTFSGTVASFTEASIGKITPKAWPGRPGGNGDGSEEWLTGSYGQTNGPYKHLVSGSGNVETLNRNASTANSIGAFLLSTSAGFLSTPLGIFISGLSIPYAHFSKGYEGAYYKLNVYYSGRCMKVVIKTYNYSWKAVKTYTRYYKW